MFIWNIGNANERCEMPENNPSRRTNHILLELIESSLLIPITFNFNEKIRSFSSIRLKSVFN